MKSSDEFAKSAKSANFANPANASVRCSSGLQISYFSPSPITFFVKSLEVTLYFTTFAASYPCQKPYGQRVGRHTYDIRRFCALWFWRSMNFANSNFLSRTKQQRTPHGVYCILPSLSSDASLHSLVGRVNYILTLTWGFRSCTTISLFSWFLSRWLSMGTQSVNFIAFSLGSYSEPTKREFGVGATNLVTFRHIFRVTRASGNIFAGEKKRWPLRKPMAI